MTNKIFGLFSILAICFFISCKAQESGDLIKQNFDFASEQLTYALQEIDSAKLKDERNSL